MKPSRHIYMTQETQEQLERLKETLNLSASGVVARALAALEDAEDPDRERRSSRRRSD